MNLTYPSIRDHFQGNPRRKWETMATVMASATHGVQARRNTAQDSFFNLMGSRPRPARVRITVRASFLKIKNAKYDLKVGSEVSKI